MWKYIDGTDSKYEVSTNGEVRNANTKILRKILRVNDGKCAVQLKIPGVTKYVHRMVAIAHIPNLNNLPQVDHIDGDKSNNHVDNLRWCTNEDNQNFRKVQGNEGKEVINRSIMYGTEVFSSIRALSRYIAKERGSKVETVRKELKSVRYGEKYMYGQLIKLV